MPSCVILKESQSLGLPDIPSDGSERHTSWLFVTGEPGFKYEGEWVAVDEDWIDFQLSEFARLTASGYEPPMLLGHLAANTEERRQGDVVILAKRKGPQGYELAAGVRWAIEDAAKLIEMGQIRYFSPGIGPIENPMGGEDFPFVLRELSQVASPHQKGQTTHIIAQEATMDPETTTESPAEVMSPEDMTRAILEMRDMIAGIIAKEQAQEAQEVETSEEPAPATEPVEASELATIRVELAEMRRERDEANFLRDFPLGGTLTLTEAVSGLLFEAFAKDPEGFAKIVAGQFKALELAQKPATKRITLNPWASVALGESGSASEPMADMSRADKIARCRAETGTSAEALALYETRYVNTSGGAA